MWSILDGLTANFVCPLRQLLAETSMQCHGELQVKQDEAKTSSKGGKRKTTDKDPAVTVEISNEVCLPEPSLEDEIEVFHALSLYEMRIMVEFFPQMLQVAQQQMDMMESVIVRVEELIRTS